jgi:Arm DNA-binding domain
LSEPIPFVRKRPAHRRILNAQTIRGLKVPKTGRVDYFDEQTPGLSLRITSNDVRTWTYFYRVNGRQKRFTLGRSPAVSLADARDLARDAERKISRGGDPAAEKRAARDVLTFGQLAEKYLELHAEEHKKSWKEDERQLRVDLLPKWKNTSAGDIKRADVRATLDRITSRGAKVAANRVRALISKIYNFGIERELVDRNPVIGVRKLAAEGSRERVLTEDEIRRVWTACETQSPAWLRGSDYGS